MTEVSLELDDRVAIVTGAASGIGKAAARSLVRQGARVAVVDVQDEPEEGIEMALGARPGDALHIRANVTRETEVKEAVATTYSRFGRIDILLNNAGVVAVSEFAETTEEQWDLVLGTNLKGAFLMSKHVVPHLEKNASGGVIINTASDAGLVGFANLAAYCASKGGIIQLTRAMAVELGRKNIRVNAVAPTSTLNTGMVDRLLDSADDPDGLHRALAEAHPLPRLGTAEEVAELMTFLASGRASYITGSVIPIDGGITAACPVPSF